MAQDESYQTKVYTEQGGDRLVAGSGGEITLESGAVLSMISAATLGFAGENIFVDDARRLMSEFGGVVNITTGTTLATESVLTQSNVPRNARIVNVVGALSGSQLSIWLTSVSAGRELLLRCIGDQLGTFTYNNTSLCVLRSGCLLLGSVGAPVASFHLQTSANSNTFLYLKAVADDTWAIIAQGGVCSES